LCDISEEAELQWTDGEMVRSPVRCLDKAVDGDPDIIAVRFARMPIPEREALVELCTVLKRNSRTRRIPILALLHVRHRKLMEELDQAGVDYIKFIGEAPSSLPPITELFDALGPEDLLERQLALVCPYLHYSAIDARREMIVCGAYLDRMVLGGKWLHDVCESESHLRCDYFLNPRLES
jgi:hypothetical protein